MKKIFIPIILLLICSTSGAQIIWTKNFPPTEFNKPVRFDSGTYNVGFPDTATANLFKVQGVFINSIAGFEIRVGNSKLMRNSSTTAWLEQVNTGPGSTSCIEGLKGGTGVVTKLTDSTFHITAAQFVKNCIQYQTGDTTIKIAQPGDTGRVDVFIAPLNGHTKWLIGAEGSTQNLSYSSDTAIVLGFVIVTDTSVNIATRIDSNWVRMGSTLYEVGNNVQMNGLITVTNGGRVLAATGAGTGNQFGAQNVTPGVTTWFGTNSDGTSHITRNSTDIIIANTSSKLLLPTVTNQSSNPANRMVVRDSLTGQLGTAPIPGGGSSQTWQQTLTTGSNLTGDNTVNNSTHTFTFHSNDGTDVSDLIANGNGIAASITAGTGNTSTLQANATQASIQYVVSSQPNTLTFNATGTFFESTIDGKGIQYSNDYAGGYVDRSLIDFGNAKQIARDTTAAHERTVIPYGGLAFRSVSALIDSLVDKGVPGAVKFYDPTDSIGTSTANAVLTSSGDMVLAGKITAVGIDNDGGGNSSFIKTTRNLILGQNPSDPATGILIAGATSGTPDLITMNAVVGPVTISSPIGTTFTTAQVTGIDISSTNYIVSGPGTYQIQTGGVNQFRLPDATSYIGNTIDVYVVIRTGQTCDIISLGGVVYDTAGNVIATLDGGANTGGKTYHFQPVLGDWHQFWLPLLLPFGLIRRMKRKQVA